MSNLFRRKLPDEKYTELQRDLAGGMTNQEASEKYGLSIGTISNYRHKWELPARPARYAPARNRGRRNQQDRAAPILVPQGLSNEEWLRYVRDAPQVPWDVRKAAGIQLYKGETEDMTAAWQPPEDPEVWALDLANLVLAQGEQVRARVAELLVAPQQDDQDQENPQEQTGPDDVVEEVVNVPHDTTPRSDSKS